MTDSLDQLPTEQINSRTRDLDRLDTLSLLTRLNNEDEGVASAVRTVLPSLARVVDLAAAQWEAGGRIVLFGAGTSGRLAILDAAELGPTFGIPPERYLARMAGGWSTVQRAVEGVEDDWEAGAAAAADLQSVDVAFGLAASGRTPWVRGALAAARERGALTVGFANVPNPELAAETDVIIVVDTGPEAVSGSTRLKAGTAQKLVLNAFSTALMVKQGKVFGNLMVDVQATNEKLRRRAVRLVVLGTEVDEEVAREALLNCNWEVKTAIAALRLQLSPSLARGRLAQVGGHLSILIERSTS